MDTFLLFLAVLLPLFAALGLVNTYSRKASMAIAPWTAGSALAASMLVRPGVTIDLPWLMLGAQVGVDAIGQLFLAFTSLLWLLAGVYGQSYLRNDTARPRFFAFYLVAIHSMRELFWRTRNASSLRLGENGLGTQAQPAKRSRFHRLRAILGSRY